MYDKEGQPLCLRRGMIKDYQDKISLVLFDALIDDVENNKSYEFKKLRVQKLMNERQVKSKALAIKNPGVQVLEDDAVESEKSRIQEKIVRNDMKTILQTSLYPECNSQVEIENPTI